MGGACSKTDILYLAAFLSSCDPPYDSGLSNYLLERADGKVVNEGDNASGRQRSRDNLSPQSVFEQLQFWLAA